MKRQVLLFIGTLMISGLSHAVGPSVRSGSGTADHEALANYYELMAKELTRKVEASRHQARVYGAFPYGSPKSTVTFDQHYSAVASRLEDAAQESLALAKQHREQAMAQR